MITYLTAAVSLPIRLVHNFETLLQQDQRKGRGMLINRLFSSSHDINDCWKILYARESGKWKQHSKHIGHYGRKLIQNNDWNERKAKKQQGGVDLICFWTWGAMSGVYPPFRQVSSKMKHSTGGGDEVTEAYLRHMYP